VARSVAFPQILTCAGRRRTPARCWFTSERVRVVFQRPLPCDDRSDADLRVVFQRPLLCDDRSDASVRVVFQRPLPCDFRSDASVRVVFQRPLQCDDCSDARFTGSSVNNRRRGYVFDGVPG
jgi:hypothetical protein